MKVRKFKKIIGIVLLSLIFFGVVAGLEFLFATALGLTFVKALAFVLLVLVLTGAALSLVWVVYILLDWVIEND